MNKGRFRLPTFLYIVHDENLNEKPADVSLTIASVEIFYNIILYTRIGIISFYLYYSDVRTIQVYNHGKLTKFRIFLYIRIRS